MCETNEERLLTVPEVAERLHVKKSFIYSHVAAGTIPHVHVGRWVRFFWSEIERWVRDGHV